MTTDIKDRFPGIPKELIDALNAEVREADPPLSGSGYQGGITFEWRWNIDTVDADPGGGRMRGNNVTPASITQLYISVISDNDVDLTALFSSLDTGDVIIPTQTAGTERWFIARVSGTPVDATTYWKVPVTILQTGLELQSGRVISTQLIFT